MDDFTRQLLQNLADALRQMDAWQAIDDVTTPGYDAMHERAYRKVRAARVALDEHVRRTFPARRPATTLPAPANDAEAARGPFVATWTADGWRSVAGVR